MKIVQITDLHIANEGTETFGVDVRQNFLDVLKAAKELLPDLLVLSGDLCYDTGDQHIYQWIKARLDFLKIPYTVISGNHDEPGLLAKTFDMEHMLVGDELYFKRAFGKHVILFLETSKGIVSEGQLEWLSHELDHLSNDVVIFMHHPPLIGGVPHMDINYPLQNMEEVQRLFNGFPHHISIFCGHYHVEKVVCSGNLTVHITPSTYFQMDWHQENFKVDHYQVALREIVIRENGTVESTVIYLPGNRF
ncbi:MAG: metallophosphoesterase [Lewinellaceae bacterium]|nr:metallophosphoesterase [Saprospiraceae bacterium]MCB9338724.1 metallophosphoesterase [Lewinellaceae bacterium]